MTTITDQEFAKFKNFIYEAAGITLSDSKKPLVTGRLSKRLIHCKLDSYGDYFRLLSSGEAPDEVQTAINLLTTNETYFFREQKHFDFLREQALAHKASRNAQPFRVWSAACSTGEEAYSIAMVLEDCLPGNWEIAGSDISTHVLQKARTGHYPEERAKLIPTAYKQRFCRRGTGPHEGTMLVDRSLRNRVTFMQANLNEAPPKLGTFDMIFLRNVMIYFDGGTKRHVVNNVLSLLKPDGHFLVGHSESLNGICETVKSIAPAIYRKP
jgi:chemotaxis protein methyltransferase CheR